MVSKINSLMKEVFVLIDWVSSLFIELVLMITSIVILYNIGEDKFECVNLHYFLWFHFIYRVTEIYLYWISW